MAMYSIAYIGVRNLVLRKRFLKVAQNDKRLMNRCGLRAVRAQRIAIFCLYAK